MRAQYICVISLIKINNSSILDRLIQTRDFVRILNIEQMLLKYCAT